ncbi:hypothetical protein JCM16358_08790 [Halanaerocella petrolearia]
MLIDLRYHIITVMIIFITLGIGILIGSTMVGNDLLIKQQQNLINNLENNLVNLRTQNSSFKTKIEELEGKLASNLKFQKTLLPLVVKGQLKNKKLLVVTGKNINSDLKQKVINTLQLANINQLEVVNNKINFEKEFNEVLIVGKVSNDIKREYSQQKQTITVGTKQLQNISGLIKLVLQLASKDLSQLRGVNFE